jgi:hypothetical protein
LSTSEFVDRMAEFPPDFVADMQHKAAMYAVEVEAIIAGIDTNGPHLFTVTDKGELLCGDAVAFACIGSGASHADSQFMNARYQRQVPWQVAITLTCIAKKRSEVAPTVGPTTDFFFIGRDGFNVFSEGIHRHLEDDMYKTLAKQQEDATKAAVGKTKEYLAEVLKRHQAPPASPVPDPPKPPEPSAQSNGAADEPPKE